MTALPHARPVSQHVSPRRAAVLLFFRGVWAGLFGGALVHVGVVTVVYFVGLLSRREMAFPGMRLTMGADGGFSLLIDLRPFLVVAIGAALLVGVVAAWYGYRRASRSAEV